MKRLLAVLALVAAATGAPAAAGEVNVWKKLESPGVRHFGNPLVWCPARRQLLFYSAFEVQAFDYGTDKWTRDYSWPGEKGFGIPGHNSDRGVSYKGTGEMTPKGLPAPARTIGGCTWDPKRKRMLMVTHGLMAAYDPVGKKWAKVECSTELSGKKTPGAPRVYGAGVCCDPVNDELLMFGHWGGRNCDLRDVTGEHSGHLGTLVYSFATSTWTRPGEKLADPERAAARAELRGIMASLSAALEEVYAARRRPAKSAAALAALEASVARLGPTKKQREELLQLSAARTSTRRAVEAAKAGKLDEALRSGAEALRALRSQLDGALRIEPPPRCASQPVYHPGTKSIVVFGGAGALRRTDLAFPQGKGGGPGAYDDTWVYDCAKRRWREIARANRPPATTIPKMVHDPASGKMILVTASSNWGGEKGQLSLWTLDVAAEKWSDCGTQPAPGGVIPRTNWTGWGTPTFELGLDPEKKLLLLTGRIGPQRDAKAINLALQLDIARLQAKPAPAWEAPPPVKPVTIPPDDGAWVARMKGLPANTWTAAKPEGGETPRRDWGVAACDPVRGDVYYFGGGHSTYQGRDVAVYCVGANRWIHGAGGHNDHLPAVGWGGTGIDFWGCPAASHQRNSYVALDGRLYKDFGTGTMRPEYRNPAMAAKGPRWSLFYDTDRGGVWRSPKIGEVTWGEGVKGTYAGVHMAAPDGRVIGFGGQLEPYNGRKCPGVVHFASLDIYSNKLTVVNVPPPFPGVIMECRPFCFVAGKGEAGSVFVYEYRKGGGHATWLYDVEKNAFTDLKPKRQPPPGEPGTVLYVPDQKAVFAPIKGVGQWVYSLERNAWAELPAAGVNVKFTGPYTQLVYSAKYGVFVNLPGTHLMRPDFSKLKWE